jgi:hypothetical protein
MSTLIHSIVNRVIQEVAGTIATNSIQELSAEERGGISTRGYVCVCLKSTAHNAVRSMPEFDMSYGEFCRQVDNTVNTILHPNQAEYYATTEDELARERALLSDEDPRKIG